MVKDITKLGYLTYWKLTDTTITPDNLRAILANEGFGSITVPDIDTAKAVQSVGNSFQTGRGLDGNYYTCVTHEDDVSVDIAIVVKRVDENAPKGSRAKPVQVDSVTYDIGAKAWASKGDPDNEATKRLIAKVERAVTFLDHAFVRPSVVEATIQSLQGWQLASGMYYIAPGHEATVSSLKRVLAQLGKSRLRSLKIDPRDADTVGDVQAECREQMESRLQALVDKMEDWKTKAKRTRNDAVQSTLAEFVALKNESELYSDVLALSLEDLQESISAMHATCATLLSGDDEWKPSPGLVRIFEAILEQYSPEDGVWRIPTTDLDGIGLPKSAYTHATYYSRTNGGGKALGSLGYRGTLNKDGYLLIRPLADRPETATDDQAAA